MYICVIICVYIYIYIYIYICVCVCVFVNKLGEKRNSQLLTHKLVTLNVLKKYICYILFTQPLRSGRI